MLKNGWIYQEGKQTALPQAFVWRRWHSLMGFWLVLFLIVHLVTNSQAALLIGDDGKGFINGANALESLPFLPFLEAAILGVPILIHLVWGIRYLFTGRYNSSKTDGSAPALTEYTRNRAYTWQRVTAWLLVFGIIAHVVHMRFIERPHSTQKDGSHFYMVRLDADEGLYSLGERLHYKIYNQQQINEMKAKLTLTSTETKPNSIETLLITQKNRQEEDFTKALEKRPLSKGQVVAVAQDFGTAELLMLRNTFKMPIMLVLYTLLVLAACFHAFNGLWTFLIKWGVTLTPRAQMLMLRTANLLMILICFLGLSAVWGTYWINLKY